MIVKFLGNRGGGSAGATMDYLLGKDRDRAKAVLLSGDPELTQRLADNLDFKNRYTVGVLSFEEQNLAEHQKQNIMQSFEETLLAGLERDQYDITWIEHTDKGRLELNFVIPNVELSTGKRLQPYFDQADRQLVENWKQITNFEHHLTDPHTPDKAQAIKTLNTQNLPQTVKEIKQQIGTAIADQIAQGNIQNRQDVTEALESAGFEITRQTDRSISIKNPDGKRNIRLEGLIYEDRQFDQQFAEEHSRAGRKYQETIAERYDTAFNKLQRLTESKQRTNQANFARKPTNHQKPIQKGFGFEYADGDNIGHHTNRTHRPDQLERMARLSDQTKTERIDRSDAESRQNPLREANTPSSGIERKQRQENLFDYRQKQQNFGRLHFRGRFKSFKNYEIKDRFSSPFDGFSEETKETIAKSHRFAQIQPKENNHEQRLHEQLQRHLERIRSSFEPTDQNQCQTERTNRSIEYSQSTLERTEQRIEQSKSTIERATQQQIKQHQRGYGMER